MSHHRVPAVALLVTIAAGAVGCSGPPQTVSGVAASYAKGYATLAELDADSRAVAVVRVDDSLGPTDHDTATLYATTVVSRVRGDLPAEPQVILATSDTIRSDGPADPLATGHDYLLFVSPFELQRGLPTGQWVVTGGTGVYAVTDDGLDLVPGGADDGLPAHLDAVPTLARHPRGEAGAGAAR